MRRRQILAGSAGIAALPVLSSAAHAGGDHHKRRVKSGLEVLAASRYRELRGQRVAVISNPTGILPNLRHGVDEMVASRSVNIVAVFGPEHGFRGSSQAGHGEEFFIDEKTGLPVYNAYNNKDKMAELFDEVGAETIVFDIQDVGARFYTYIWTMYLALEAAAVTGKRFVVLDRPNPITGRRAMGPVLHPEKASFVGLKAISQQHGMTVGELAKLFNAEFVPAVAGRSADLTVVPLDGWFRDMWYEETGLPWVPPSPNMPTVDTAVVYPGMCLFEAGHATEGLAEGRGTTRPFELIGAPHLNHRWEEALNPMRLPGVDFKEAYFNPTFAKYTGKICGGVQVFVTDRDDFDPIRTAIAMLITAKALQPEGKIFWRTDNWIDKLSGSEWVRTAIDSGKSVDEVVAGWQGELAAFRAIRERHLIYRRVRRNED